MPDKRLIIITSIYLVLIFQQIQSLESPLQCWRCEVAVQSKDQPGVFLDDCQAQFDFTQHTREKCDGKCWKSVDLIGSKRFLNHTRNQTISFFSLLTLPKLKSSRRCFSANELVRAAEMGVNTSDGCRQVKRDNRKTKEVCFCSDQDMCNNTLKFSSNNLFIFMFFVHLLTINQIHS